MNVFDCQIFIIFMTQMSEKDMTTSLVTREIHIPPGLPDILKQYTKALLREQPDDIIDWSARYFTQLSKDGSSSVASELPFLEGIETEPNLVTEDQLRQLWQEFCDSDIISMLQLRNFWFSCELSDIELERLWLLGGFDSEFISASNFLALACSTLTENLNETLSLAVRLMSKDNNGIPLSLLQSVYDFLAKMDPDISEETKMNDLDFYHSHQQNGLIRCEVIRK